LQNVPKHPKNIDKISTLPVIELCDTEPDVIPQFSSHFLNGKMQCLPTNSPANDVAITEYHMKHSINTLAMEDSRPKEGTLVQKMKQLTKFFKSEYALSSLQQFVVLFMMMMTKLMRNRVVLWIQLFHHIGCGFFIGLIFLNSANDGMRMFDHLKFCMGCVFFVVYTQIMVPILSCEFSIFPIFCHFLILLLFFHVLIIF
jgi:hypothetical protein